MIYSNTTKIICISISFCHWLQWFICSWDTLSVLW